MLKLFTFRSRHQEVFYSCFAEKFSMAAAKDRNVFVLTFCAVISRKLPNQIQTVCLLIQLMSRIGRNIISKYLQTWKLKHSKLARRKQITNFLINTETSGENISKIRHLIAMKFSVIVFPVRFVYTLYYHICINGRKLSISLSVINFLVAHVLGKFPNVT